MTFTYASADLTSGNQTTKNRALIRVRLGDTVDASHVLENEDIESVLNDWGGAGSASINIRGAALACCDLALAKRSHQADSSGAGINVTRSQRFQQLKDVRAILAGTATTTCETVVVTDSADERAELVAGDNPPIFSVGQDRYR